MTSISNSSWLEIWVNTGDIYANSYIDDESIFYYNGESIIGPPDGEYTTIFVDYTVGFITIDMGQDEEIIDIPYKVGDAVKVIDGPFTDFSGTVEEISREKKKLKVMVSIFGRSTPVELDFLQVDLEKAN